ncbi:unnamed protein product, partial [Allacma fusca]
MEEAAEATAVETVLEEAAILVDLEEVEEEEEEEVTAAVAEEVMG